MIHLRQIMLKELRRRNYFGGPVIQAQSGTERTVVVVRCSSLRTPSIPGRVVEGWGTRCNFHWRSTVRP